MDNNIKITPQQARYLVVDYIRTTGAQWIDTGVTPTINTDAYIKTMRIKDGEVVSSSYWNIPFGQRTTNAQFLMSCNHDGSVGADWGSITIVTGEYVVVPIATQYTSEIRTLGGNKAFYVNGVLNSEVPLSQFSGTANYTIKIGGFNKGSSTVETRNSQFNWYNVKIWEDNILIRNFIPAIRVSDFARGMYDKANDIFYTNAGSGTFSYGSTTGEFY